MSDKELELVFLHIDLRDGYVERGYVYWVEDVLAGKLPLPVVYDPFVDVRGWLERDRIKQWKYVTTSGINFNEETRKRAEEEMRKINNENH